MKSPKESEASMSQENLDAWFQSARDRIEQELSGLREQVAEAISKPAPAPPPAAPPAGVDALVGAVRQFAVANTQVALLNALVDAAAGLAPRVMLLIRKGQGLHGWTGRGFDQDFIDAQLKKIRWDYDAFPELTRVIHQKEAVFANFSELSEISREIEGFDGFVPFKACFFPIVVKHKAAAMLYVDSGSESQISNRDQLEVLTYMAGLDLTLITSKLKTPREAKQQATGDSAEAAAEEPAADLDDTMARSIVPPQAVVSGATTVPAGEGEEPQPVKKAKRVARVLVSDLLLYNEEAVAAGRQSHDLYERLKEDLDRSYQHYQERVSGLELDGGTNYFKEELIRQLADGDADALGPLPF